MFEHKLVAAQDDAVTTRVICTKGENNLLEALHVMEVLDEQGKFHLGFDPLILVWARFACSPQVAMLIENLVKGRRDLTLVFRWEDVHVAAAYHSSAACLTDIPTLHLTMEYLEEFMEEDGDPQHVYDAVRRLLEQNDQLESLILHMTCNDDDYFMNADAGDLNGIIQGLTTNVTLRELILK